ncbi:MAG: helix-turn-helix domain-containing protein [Planctomycetales bacterium]
MPSMVDENTAELNRTRESLVPIVSPWIRAYSECSDAIQAVVREMLDIIASDSAEDDEREMAISTVREALFPSNRPGGLGSDLEELEEDAKSHIPGYAELLRQMDEEESTFADRVGSLMKDKSLTQEALANAIGVGQSAISMMLMRQSRPQKRTVVRIAEALGVTPSELWPGFEE